MDYAETIALIALRYAYLMKTKLEGDQRERFANALRQVQAHTFDLVKQRNAHEVGLCRLRLQASRPTCPTLTLSLPSRAGATTCPRKTPSSS